MSPGGIISTGHEDIVIKPSGNLESADDLRRTLITAPGRRDAVFLGDVVDIFDTYEDPRSMVHSHRRTSTCKEAEDPSCRRGMAIAVSLRQGGNISDLAKQVRQTVTAFEATSYRGISFDYIAFQPDRVDKSVDDFASNLLQRPNNNPCP